ncbi:MAG: hypothetical protein Q4B06_03795 [Candidatus Saccharibacteria bacterium]|nr:hypothetical protein [Candidatus Saccharibacteria bacterium]
MTTKLLIFGITGDLSRRKLLPALQQIVTVDEFTSLELFGVSRREVDAEALLGDLANRTTIITMNVAELAEYSRLASQLSLAENDQLLIYLSVPPRAATQIVDFLGEAGLNDNRVKILFEKPFGLDLESAHEMVERTSRYFHESQIYRIDHYMAKEMAQNIVAFRANNALFARSWDAAAIEKIEVNAFERIDIEGRAQFYEQTGALRDVVQGHLLQLLALVLMDVPYDIDWDKLPEYRLAALRSLLPADPEKALRAQYEGYTSEVGVPHSCVETFVSTELASSDARWQGVPLVLTTGKALDKKCTEIQVHFRRACATQTDYLTFRIQPHEGIEMTLNTKKPGYDNQLEERHLAFSYPEDISLPDAYEQVIVDAIRSRKSLFTSSDEIIRAWEILQPLVDTWDMCPKDSIPRYQKGDSAETVRANNV